MEVTYRDGRFKRLDQTRTTDTFLLNGHLHMRVWYAPADQSKEIAKPLVCNLETGGVFEPDGATQATSVEMIPGRFVEGPTQ